MLQVVHIQFQLSFHANYFMKDEVQKVIFGMELHLYMQVNEPFINAVKNMQICNAFNNTSFGIFSIRIIWLF